MVEVIIDTNADIDVLLRELQRLLQSLRTQTTTTITTTTTTAGPRLLRWGDVYTDETLRDLFQERLSSVMSAAKSQRTIHFPRERLIMNSHDEVEIDILAQHLRILPESAIRSKNKQEDRKSAFKEAKVKALEEHREKMLRLAMQGIELPRGGGIKNEGKENVDGEKSEVTADKKTEEEKKKNKNKKKSEEEEDDDDDFIAPPPPPPPMGEEEEDSNSSSSYNDDNETSDENSNNSEDDDENDLPPPPPPPLSEEDDNDESDNDDDIPPPPPPPE